MKLISYCNFAFQLFVDIYGLTTLDTSGESSNKLALNLGWIDHLVFRSNRCAVGILIRAVRWQQRCLLIHKSLKGAEKVSVKHGV